MTMAIDHIIFMYQLPWDIIIFLLEPIIIDTNVSRLLVLKALSSINMIRPYDRVTMTNGISGVFPQSIHSSTTIWKVLVISGIMSLHMNIFWQKLILFICFTQMSMIIPFLSNGDSKYIYVFPLMINVVLRISYKECYWAYSDYNGLFLRWSIIQ
jgi:hypothetical protein